jgi:hypothetical protein
MGDGVLRFNLGRAAAASYVTHSHIGDVLEKRAREREVGATRRRHCRPVKGLGGCG